jgi:hypothetical protein
MGTPNVRLAMITVLRLWRDEPIKILQKSPLRETQALCPFPQQICSSILFPNAFPPTRTRKKRSQKRTASSSQESRSIRSQRTRTQRPKRECLIRMRISPKNQFNRDISTFAIFLSKKVKWSLSSKMFLSISNLPKPSRNRSLRPLPG